MLSICGQPYIDTRLSFNSYLPQKLDDELSNKLVNSWLKKLRHNPFLHDKIEFEIAITCYSFDLAEKLENDYDQIFSESQIHKIIDSYRALTLNFINKHFEYLNTRLYKNGELIIRFESFQSRRSKLKIKNYKFISNVYLFYEFLIYRFLIILL